MSTDPRKVANARYANSNNPYEMTSDGIRAMASNALDESGLWHPDAIERADR